MIREELHWHWPIGTRAKFCCGWLPPENQWHAGTIIAHETVHAGIVAVLWIKFDTPVPCGQSKFEVCTVYGEGQLQRI